MFKENYLPPEMDSCEAAPESGFATSASSLSNGNNAGSYGTETLGKPINNQKTRTLQKTRLL